MTDEARPDPIEVHLVGDLGDLAGEERSVVPSGERRSTKDLVESLGIPHTEIAELMVDGDPTGLDAHVVGNDADDEELEAVAVTCLRCNGLLEPVEKREIAHRLEPGTRRDHDEFVRCSGCARIYWPGSHQARLREIADLARERDPATDSFS